MLDLSLTTSAGHDVALDRAGMTAFRDIMFLAAGR
jgi:hypothetical protein